jgi:exosortase
LQSDKPINSINTIQPVRIRLLLLLLLLVLAGVFLYGTALKDLISAVVNRQGSSHGVFVPFLSGFFIWMKRDTLREIEPVYDVLGLPLIVIAAVPPLLDIGKFYLQSISFFVFTAGLIWVVLGKKIIKEVSFPLFFLITMVPLPDAFYLDLANLMRSITYGASSWFISFIGIPNFKAGYVLHLPNAALQVNLGCSGIRYLISYFVFGLAYAYISRERMISRLLVIGSTIPISIIASILRLVAIISLTYIFGPHMAEYWPHVIISWSVFFGILILSIGLDQFFQK